MAPEAVSGIPQEQHPAGLPVRKINEAAFLMCQNVALIVNPCSFQRRV